MDPGLAPFTSKRMTREFRAVGQHDLDAIRATSRIITVEQTKQ
jgi:hypothetical protein